MIKGSIMERFREFHNIQRSGYSDFILLHYFEIILNQYKYLDRTGDTLFDYINELEYRGLKYKL